MTSETHHTAHPVSAEDVAAFAEGRLTGAERERVADHLADCDECRHWLAETLALLGEGAESPAGTADGGPGTPPVRSRWPRWTVLVAAAAAVALVTAVVVRTTARPAPPARGEWLAAMPPAELLLPLVGEGAVFRGGEETPAPLARQSAEVGELLVDLEVACAAGDAEATAALALRLAAVVEKAGLLDDDVAALRAALRLPPAQVPAAVQQAVEAAEPRLRLRFSPFHLDLGAFAEQARLALAAGEEGFLAARPPRRYLEWLLAQDAEPLPPQARERLEVLADPAAPAAQRARAAADVAAAFEPGL